MNFIATLFSIGLIVGCNTALAAEAGEPNGADTTNPFSGALSFGTATPGIMRAGDDLSNPFTEAHLFEQVAYERLYYIHYHGLITDVNAPAPQEMPGAFDAQGRPLWFDGPRGVNSLQNLVAQLFSLGQFDDLDHLFDDWNNPSERMADGRWKLMRFEYAISNLFSNTHSWDAGYQLIRRWRDKTPKSHAAALTEALYWYEYAWNARGQGNARSVTAEGWKLFHERLAKAEAVLLESKSYASSSPLWGSIYIDVGTGLSLKKARLAEIFFEATKEEKYFYSVYFNMAGTLQPKWGGSWKLVDIFIKDTVKNTQKVEGYSMYARLYWSINQGEDLEFDLFRDSLASWPDMKRGFEDIIRNYPHSAWNINNFAAFACIAGDKETFQSLRFRIGKTITRGAWPSNYSLDLCEHKFEAKAL